MDGDPISNYFAWQATVFVLYPLFALLIRRNRRAQSAMSYGVTTRALIVFYALCAAGNNHEIPGHPDPAEDRDPSGVGDITAASALCLDFCHGSVRGVRLDRALSARYRLNNSRSRLVCARLTGISVCVLSFMRS